ncbi:MAG: GntR family transcriptional regulator [Lachnospiraceae bacterium]|nr:GntR family transcriptional regulator [Lachnospiraceae bacterium]
MTGKPEEAENKSKQIYKDVLWKIIRLEYMPGDKISENELCSIYGTTRHNVRGALSVLKEKGFVEIYPQRGTFVSLLKIDHLHQVLFIREAIEQEAFYELITGGIDPKYLKTLKKLVSEQEKTGGIIKNPEEFFNLDDEFHATLVKAIGKEASLSMLKDAHMHTRRWRNIGLDTLEPVDNLTAEHEKLIEAIETGNWRAGRDVIHNHINAVISYSEKAMAKHPKYFA